MFFKKKLSMAILSGIFMSAGCSDDNYMINIGNINVKETLTDGNGIAYFEDDQNKNNVEILVAGISPSEAGTVTANKSSDNFRVQNVSVLFFDGENFSGYHMEHEYLNPLMQIPLISSSHVYVMLPAPLEIITFDSENNEKSKEAAENFVEWAEKYWENRGCHDLGYLLASNSLETYIIKSSVIKTISFREEDEKLKKLFLNLLIPQDSFVRIYSLKLSDYGFKTDTLLRIVETGYRSLDECIDG